MYSAHIFTGQGFNYEQVPNYSKSIFFKPVSIVFEELFKKRIPQRDVLTRSLASKNEISAAILLISCLESIDKITSTQPAPLVIAGYSVGQLIAMHHAGCMAQEETISLVLQRCLVMNHAISYTHPVTMIAVVGAPLKKIKTGLEDYKLSKEIYLTNDNGVGSYTFAVPNTLINLFSSICTKAGAFRFVDLKTDGGWHSPYMSAACKSLEPILGNIDFKNPIIKIIDNTYVETGKLTVPNVFKTLSDHMIKPVRWSETISAFNCENIKQVIEISHFDILTKMSKLTAPKIKFTPARSIICAE
jgi:[acyl-carrier-protein] S-malonyltransferase